MHRSLNYDATSCWCVMPVCPMRHCVHAHVRLAVSCTRTWVVVVYALHLDHVRVASRYLRCYNYFMCTLGCVTCGGLLASSMSWGSCHQLRLMNARVSQWLRSTCESKSMWEILSLVCATHCGRVACVSENFLCHVVSYAYSMKIFMRSSHSISMWVYVCTRFARSSRRV